jgi:hypothetical protein
MLKHTLQDEGMNLEGLMRHDELIAKLEDLRSIIADKLAELAERPKWGSEEEREEVINAIDDLDGQLDLLREALEQPDDDHDDGAEDEG